MDSRGAVYHVIQYLLNTTRVEIIMNYHNEYSVDVMRCPNFLYLHMGGHKKTWPPSHNLNTIYCVVVEFCTACWLNNVLPLPGKIKIIV